MCRDETVTNMHTDGLVYTIDLMVCSVTSDLSYCTRLTKRRSAERMHASMSFSFADFTLSVREYVFYFFSDFKNAFLNGYLTDISKKTYSKSLVFHISKWVHNFALVLHLFLKAFSLQYVSLLWLSNFPWHWIAYNVLMCRWKADHSHRIDWVVAKTITFFTFLRFQKRDFLRFWVVAHVFSNTAQAHTYDVVRVREIFQFYYILYGRFALCRHRHSHITQYTRHWLTYCLT